MSNGASTATTKSPTTTRRKKIIIDTDCGGDDIVGILVAAADPNVEIVALCAVWGNVDIDQGVKNLAVVADAVGLDIPIYIGAGGPLLGGERETTQWYGFGKDGMGDAGFPLSPRVGWAHRNKHASLALIDILSAISDNDQDVWQVYAIGPLTNIAIALQLRPDLLKKLGNPESGDPGLIVMGGAMYSKGNANLTSEFNFACDPEAAKVVFNNRGFLRMPICVVTWELTVEAAIPWEMFDKMLGRSAIKRQRRSSTVGATATTTMLTDRTASTGSIAATAPVAPMELAMSSSVNFMNKDRLMSGVFSNFDGTATSTLEPAWLVELNRAERNEKIGVFLGKILGVFEETSRPKEVDLDDVERTQDSCVIPDAIAIAIGLNPSLILEKTRTFATIELAGSNTRGMLCTSWYGNEKSLAAKGQWINADVITKVDVDKIMAPLARITHIGKEKR